MNGMNALYPVKVMLTLPGQEQSSSVKVWIVKHQTSTCNMELHTQMALSLTCATAAQGWKIVTSLT